MPRTSWIGTGKSWRSRTTSGETQFTTEQWASIPNAIRPSRRFWRLTLIRCLLLMISFICSSRFNSLKAKKTLNLTQESTKVFFQNSSTCLVSPIIIRFAKSLSITWNCCWGKFWIVKTIIITLLFIFPHIMVISNLHACLLLKVPTLIQLPPPKHPSKLAKTNFLEAFSKPWMMLPVLQMSKTWSILWTAVKTSIQDPQL